MTEPLPTTSPDSASGSPSFEAALARLETVVHELEEGRIGLAEALARYEEGVILLRQCFALLESAERQIELLTGVDAAGNPIVEPFDDTASTERAEQGVPRSRSRTATPKKSKATSTPSAEPDVVSSETSSAESSQTSPPGGPPGIAPGRNKMDLPRGLF
jgi:exodeoxyribonuclease VII small subunit